MELNGHHRKDDITLKLPWGAELHASGAMVVVILLILLVNGIVFYSVEMHNASVSQQQQKTRDAIDDLMCVLTLTPEERIEARKGASLQRWCVFLSARDERR